MLQAPQGGHRGHEEAAGAGKRKVFDQGEPTENVQLLNPWTIKMSPPLSLALFKDLK